MLSRRNFVAALGVAGGTLGLSGPKVAAAFRSPATAGKPVLGDRFAGFALLPEGAPVPYDLQPPRRNPPITCGTGAGRGGAEVTGRAVPVSDARDAAVYSRVPLFEPTGFDSVLTPNNANVMEHEDGEPFLVTLAYDSFDAETGERSTNVVLSAMPDFTRPVPLWASNPVEPGGPHVELERVHFTPTPGVMVRGVDGFTFHWIAFDVYYTLIVENHAPLSEVRRLVESLAPVRP